MLRQTKWGVQNGPITKNGVLPVTNLFFWQFLFSLRTSYKEVTWCTTQIPIVVIFVSVGVLFEATSSLCVSLTHTFSDLWNIMANVLFSAFMEACIPYLWYTNKIKNLALIFVFKIFVSRLQVKMAQNVKTKRSLNRDFKKIYIYIYFFGTGTSNIVKKICTNTSTTRRNNPPQNPHDYKNWFEHIRKVWGKRN